MKTILYHIIVTSLILPMSIARVLGGMLCKKQSDCTEDQCCAVMYMSASSGGFCMPAKQLGDRCTSTFFYGKGFTCGCRSGLTCAIVEVDKKTRRSKHRCVKLDPQVLEIREGQKDIDSLPKSSRLTAKSVREYLKRYSDKNDNNVKKTT